MRLAHLLLCLSAVNAFAQLQELTTTSDGSQLYFSSQFRQTGTDQFNSYKIFRYANGEFSLIAQTPPFVSLGQGAREQDNLRAPNVSADGKILAWDESAECTIGTASCDPNRVLISATVRGTVTGATLPDDLKLGSVRVSPNGRYYLTFCCWIGPSTAPPLLYDSLTGARTPIPNFLAVGEALQNIADDGSLILISPATANYVLWKGGVAKELTVGNQNRETPRISGDGSTFVFQTLDPLTERVKLVARDLTTGAETFSLLGPAGIFGGGIGPPIYVGAYFLPSISYDGRRILFRAPDSTGIPQAFVINRDGSGLLKLSDEPAGIAEVTLSGDGHIGYAITQHQGLIRIGIDAANITHLIPDMPQWFSTFPNIAVPGSRLYVRGQGLLTHAGGSLVSLQGVQAPLISVSSTLVMLQVPWEYDSANSLTVIFSAPQSPFELAIPIPAAAAAPALIDAWSIDYTNNLTNSGKPAKAGDIIVIDALGLGPVTSQPATGQPTPLTPFSFATLPVSCDFTAANASLGSGEILFAGLTPTLVGAYQINVRTPASIPNQVQNVAVTCSAGRATSQPLNFFLQR